MLDAAQINSGHRVLDVACGTGVLAREAALWVGPTGFVDTAQFPSIRMMVEADLRGWLPVMDVVLSEEQIQQILAEAEAALSAYVTAAGEVMFESSAHIIIGGKP